MSALDGRGKIVVAGGGRAGATLLLDVLRAVGIADAGSAPSPIESPKSGRVVAVEDARRLSVLLDAGATDVAHVLVPVRDLDIAAASRVRAARHTVGVTDARGALGRTGYELLETVARFELPHTLLDFPRFAEDPRYLADRLSFLDPTLPFDAWRDALARCAQPERIREQRLDRRERIETVARIPLAQLARPLHALRTRPSRARSTGTRPGHDGVTVHVASLNTAAATELCIRSMRRRAGTAFDLVVGDCGSTDGSLELLRDLETRGWLRLEVAPEGRMHADWLDRWLASCPTRYAVFADSDVEFLRDGWLGDMVETSRAHDAALVCAQLQPGQARFVHPRTGARATVRARPAPWLLLIDVDAVRGRVEQSFRYVESPAPDAFGGRLGHDVGGAFLLALRDAGLGWVEMPPAFRRKFHHYGGLSWKGGGDRVSWLRRAEQLRRVATVQAHLARARLLRYGEGSRASG
jgi:glycosyl transferase family 2